MPDHVLESGDSPELEDLFNTLVSAAKTPPAPMTSNTSGDSPELEALFDTVAHQAAPVDPPVAIAPVAASARSLAASSGDNDELQALFDSLSVQEDAVVAAMPDTCSAIPEINPQVAEMYSRVGRMTRKLHDALHEVGFDKSLERATSAIPDAKDRLAYIASLTENAAMRALNAVDQAEPLQDTLENKATALAASWDRLYANQLSVEAFKALSVETRDYLHAVPTHTQGTRTQLLEIMMAQDFQDLTGQVIKKIVDMIQLMESELLSFLVEFSDPKIEPDKCGLLNGPVINAEGRNDVVTSQQQVDDLLDSLGF